MRSVAVDRPRLFGFLSLFTSFGTLLCCALPSLLVLLGFGATVASFLSVAPWLVTLSHHKVRVFTGAGTFIAMNVLYVYKFAPHLRNQMSSCPPDDPPACAGADRMSRAVLWVSVVIYLVGFFTAYVVGPFLVRFG